MTQWRMISMASKPKIFFVFFIAIIFIQNACPQSGSKGIQTGAWSNDRQVFTNEWSNIRVNVPNGYRALTPEEIKKIVGMGEEIAINDGVFDKSTVNISKKRTVYDFIIVSDDSATNFILMYENVGIQTTLGNLDENGYLNELKKNLEKVKSLSYTSAGTSTRRLAGEDWLVGSFSLGSNKIYQDYYIKKAGKIMFVFIATYSSKKAADKFMTSIDKVK